MAKGSKTDVELVISAKNEATKVISELVNSIQNLGKEAGSGGLLNVFSNIKKATADVAISQSELAENFKQVKLAQEQLNKVSKDRDNDLKQQKDVIERTQAALDDLKTKYDELKDSTTQARTPSARLVETLDAQIKKQKELSDIIQTTSAELQKSQSALGANQGIDNRASKTIADQQKKVIELGKSWRETTTAIAEAKRVLGERSATLGVNSDNQTVEKGKLDALQAELKAAKELEKLRRKEVRDAVEATDEQIAARNKAVEAVKELKAAVEAQIIVERKAREERDKSNSSFNAQSKLVEKLIDKAGKQKTAYDELKKSASDFEATQRQAGTDRQQANIERLTKILKELQDQYQGVSERVVASQDRINKATGPDPRVLSRFDALKVKIAETETELKQQQDSLSKLNKQYEKAGFTVEEFEKAQRDLDQATESLTKKQKALSAETNNTAKAADRAGKEAQQAGKRFRVWGEDSRQTLSFMQRIRGELLSLAATYTGLYAVGAGVRSIYDASVLTQKGTSRLAAKFDGDFTKINEEMQFVRTEADRLGIEFETLLDQYTKFVNNVPEGQLSLEQIKFTFTGIAEASRAAGLGTQDVQGVFTALGQIASKGTVSMEELRQQLGERLPAVLENTAKGLSELSGELITTEELVKRIGNGQVSATAIVALAKAMKDEFGPALEEAMKSPLVALARFQNTIFDIRLELAKSGFIEELTKGLEELNKELRTGEFKDGLRDIASALVSITKAGVAFVKNLDTVIALFKAVLAFKLASYFTTLAGAILKTTAAIGAGIIGLKSYGSVAATLAVTIKSLARGFLILPGVFYAGYAAGQQLFKSFPGLEAVMKKFIVGFLGTFDKLKISINENVDLVTTYFKRGWVNVIKDVAKLMTDVIPLALSVALKLASKALGVFSKDLEKTVNEIANHVASSNDDLIDKLIPTDEVDMTAQFAKIRADAEKARRQVDDVVTQMFIDIDAKSKPVKVIDPEAGKKDGDKYGEEFINSLKDLDYFQAGSNAGKSLGEGLLEQLKKIEEKLAEESATTLEQRLALIKSEYQDFIDELGQFNAQNSKSISDIEEKAQKRIQELRNNTSLNAETKAKNIAEIETKAAQEVARIQSESSQLSGASGTVQKLIAVRQEKERQKYYDEKAKEAETTVNDLVTKRKDELARINELTELGLITTEEQQVRISKLNDESLAKIREAVTEATKLAETSGSASLKDFVSGFDGLEEIERRRIVVEQVAEAEKKINEELSLRDTKLNTINTLRETGVIDAATAEERGRQTLEESNRILGEMVDKAIKMAESLGDNGLVAKLEGVKAGLKDVNEEVFSGAELSQDFASGFAGAFRSFVQGTQTASEAFKQFIVNFLLNIAEAIMQAVILKAITGSITGGSGGAGGLLADGLNALINHTGGIVGQDGTRRTVSPLAFLNAIRYHSGGIAGLKPDEVPTVLQKGEEVLTRDDPRHRYNQQSSGQTLGVNIVNTIDSGSFVSQGLSTPSGSKAVLNFIRSNKSSIKSVLA